MWSGGGLSGLPVLRDALGRSSLMARGGARSGRPGQQYSNRSDLQNAPRLAPTANQGQPYGTATSQLQSQQAVPMAPAPGPAPVPISAPTSRPTEPVQAGLSLGPGPGPESIPALAPSQSPDPDLFALAAYLPALELLTTLPNASSATRNFVRRLRGAIPNEPTQTSS